ncbi:MAG TPA: prepilin-type N-terminal cleavage/methylation domain-containing protein [Oligoflexia bacterium]|nr:prepilin-type N-terminal cleavage/methylation domain-containing protein [Oligoflexia bacterium]HMP27679.1 prepilin-type N-terminal cleavage/methylation domain-containing protein [Oligoflexia bacterium]
MIKKTKHATGFTLIELIVVLIIIGVAIGLVAIRTEAFSGLRQDGAIRRLTESLVLLHQQAIIDQEFYIIEFDLQNNSYKVGALKADSWMAFQSNPQLLALANDAGNLTLELASFLSPNLGRDQEMIPPPSLPSLAEPTELPDGLSFLDIQTFQGKITPDTGVKPYLLFSPRGFSDFGVIHLTGVDGRPMTILVNPFTGLTKVYREYRDFNWTYGSRNQE